MKLIDVPVCTPEGDLRFTVSLTPDEAQYLLQFAINFKLAMASSFQVVAPSEIDEEQQELND